MAIVNLMKLLVTHISPTEGEGWDQYVGGRECAKFMPGRIVADSNRLGRTAIRKEIISSTITELVFSDRYIARNHKARHLTCSDKIRCWYVRCSGEISRLQDSLIPIPHHNPRSGPRYG